ncbi:MAG TPA: Na+/H+ antiporter NhaA, partial [Oculatellaceae cyanobacterium]
LLWFSMLKSGIHATIAGVLLALCIPASSNIKPERFYDDGMTVLGTLRQVGGTSRYAILEEDDYQAGVHKIATLCEEAQSPLQRLEHGLHPWVTFGIMPVFALANAGVSFSTGSFTQSLSHPVSLGIIVGMVLGKQSGIFLFSWLTVRLGLSKLPDGIQWRHMLGLACLGGIGFTMSLFIAELAFQGNILTTAKIGILAGSIASGVLGGGILLSVLRQNPQPVANISTPD